MPSLAREVWGVVASSCCIGGFSLAGTFRYLRINSNYLLPLSLMSDRSVSNQSNWKYSAFRKLSLDKNDIDIRA